MSEKITFACITQNRIENLKRNLPTILPWVDRAVIIDGGSVDGTEEYLKSLAPKVQRVYRKWDDSFQNQYSEYLEHIHNGWVLICDDDELPSEAMLKSLRSIVDSSGAGHNYSVVSFTCNPQNPDTGWDPGPVSYTRELLFRYTPRLRYQRRLHQVLVGYQNRKRIVRPETYYHIKSEKDEFRNACRNYWISGCWPAHEAQDGVRGPDWHELKAVVRQYHPDVQVFSDLNSLFILGNVHPDIKAWMKEYKDIEGNLYGELRCWHKYYFEILHPEEVDDL